MLSRELTLKVKTRAAICIDHLKKQEKKNKKKKKLKKKTTT
jgi:hypothetical protein